MSAHLRGMRPRSPAAAAFASAREHRRLMQKGVVVDLLDEKIRHVGARDEPACPAARIGQRAIGIRLRPIGQDHGTHDHPVKLAPTDDPFTVSRPIPLLAPMMRTVAMASLLHGRTRLAHHHVRCRQPHRKIGERLADKAAHALPASGAAGAPAATRAPAATGAHRSPQGATGANASLDPLELWSVGRQPRLTASAISSGVAFVWIRTDFTGGAIGATAEVTGGVTGALAATGAPAATGATSNKQFMSPET